MKTKIIEIGGSKYQLRKMTPAAGSFIYFKMIGAVLNQVNEATVADTAKARESSAKMTPEEKARALVVSTFMRGLDYQHVEFAQRHAMMATSRVVDTGGAEAIIPVMTDDGRWVQPGPGEPDLQDEPDVVQQITTEALVYSIASFFGAGSTRR